jgi:hypothetical protein
LERGGRNEISSPSTVDSASANNVTRTTHVSNVHSILCCRITVLLIVIDS